MPTPALPGDVARKLLAQQHGEADQLDQHGGAGAQMFAGCQVPTTQELVAADMMCGVEELCLSAALGGKVEKSRHEKPWCDRMS